MGSNGEWRDLSVLEAASWRLASELVRRHPGELRILRTHPGGGQYDCLTITTPTADGGTIQLNRRGTIQVHRPFGEIASSAWEPVQWDEYLRDDPREFLGRLEAAAGLSAPPRVPASTPLTLTYRALAAIASTAVKGVHPIDIQPGYIDTSGYGGGPNSMLDEFTAVPPELRSRLTGDLYDEPGYRFWIVTRNAVPLIALEQARGIAWWPHRSESLNLITEYNESKRSVNMLAMKLLSFADLL